MNAASGQGHQKPKRRTVSLQETCQITGLGITLVKELVRDNKLRSAKIGRRRLVFLDSIDRLLEEAA